MTLRRQLAATSAQNEFSKWAKLQRQVDKLTVQLEKKSTFPHHTFSGSRMLTTHIEAGLEANKAQFDKMVGGARWLGTTGMRMLLQFWFSKQPMFWLPHGFVPYYGEWLLSFPRAPLGAVSIQVWGMACGTAILLVSEALVALVGLAMEMKNAPAKVQKTKEKVPMKMAGEKEVVDEKVKKEL